MTIFTDIGRLDMLGIFTGGGSSIVATDTVAGYTAVIKDCIPVIGTMTIVTLVITGNMIRTLANGDRAVVTGHTTAQYMRMIDPADRRPGIGAMTVLTDVTGLDMAGALAHLLCTVVATDTVTRDAGVIESRRIPVGSGMTNVTFISTGDVIGVLTDGDIAVMTADTGAKHLVVIDTTLR